MIDENGNAICDSCSKEYDYFSSPMLRDELWQSISNEYVDENGKWHGQLFCLDCIEKKLGRKLKIEDLSQYATAEHNRDLIEKLKNG